MAAVEIEDLRHSYQDRLVLSGLHFSVEPGEIFGLLGPNGGGKTTLFKILSTLITPSQGRALIFGSDVVRAPHAARQKLGVVFQAPSIDKKLTLRENLKTQGALYGLHGNALAQKTEELLERFGLADRGNDLAEVLSGGLQRRLEIAKGMLHNPQVLLMDEPSTGLDPGARHDLWELLFDLKEKGMTIMLTTHLLEEGDKCDRLAILDRGVAVALGTPSNLKNKIGGDVITIQTEEPVELARQLNEKLAVNAHAINGLVRLEKMEGHKFIPTLVETFPGAISSISVGKPTLEDVFVHETGRGYWQSTVS
jgi:ABC-2 type transport system ATP-binding protein